MSSLGVLADHLLVCQSLSHHHLHVLAVPLDKESYFVCLFAMTFLSAMMWVLSFSLPIPHGMHLVVPTHSYLFGWYVIQVGHFPLKEPEQELQNRFSPFPTAWPYPFTSNPWPHHFLYWLDTGWWCLGLARALLLCMSKIYLLLMHLPWPGGFFAHFAAYPWLLMAWATFWFLILYGPLPLRLGFAWLWAFLLSAHSFALFYSFAFPAALFCHCYCGVIWPKPARLL